MEILVTLLEAGERGEGVGGGGISRSFVEAGRGHEAGREAERGGKKRCPAWCHAPRAARPRWRCARV